MPDIDPLHAPEPRTLLAWDGVRYRPLLIDLSRRLQVRGEDQVFSFKDTLEILVTGDLPVADGSLATGLVPAGEIWVITGVAATNATAPWTSLVVSRDSGGVGYRFGGVVNAFAIGDIVSWEGLQYAKEDDAIRAYFFGGLLNDSCAIWVTGYTMTKET